jgi:hypothetical protein
MTQICQLFAHGQPIRHEGGLVKIDLAKPVTLARLALIAERFEAREVMFFDGSKKNVYSFPSNCLTIWEDGYPIFENNNGKICADRVALADCLI